MFGVGFGRISVSDHDFSLSSACGALHLGKQMSVRYFAATNELTLMQKFCQIT